MKTKVLLANPRGFCAGVDRAIDIVNQALKKFGPPIYVRHEVVHNKTVVNELKSLGAIFVEEIEEVPAGETVIYSAHGVSKVVQKDSKEKHLEIYDATCPLVSKVHAEVIKYSKLGYECILIGHQNHPEVEGTMGQFDDSFGGSIHLVESVEDVSELQIGDPTNLVYVTQTTLSIDDTQTIMDSLKTRFPEIHGPKTNDICYATQNRQDSVKQLTLECDLVLVIGSVNSSNSNRLKEISTRSGVPSYLLDSADDLDVKWLSNKKNIGLTAGASAPEILVQSIINKLKAYGAINVINAAGVEESITFKIPKELVTKN